MSVSEFFKKLDHYLGMAPTAGTIRMMHDGSAREAKEKGKAAVDAAIKKVNKTFTESGQPLKGKDYEDAIKAARKEYTTTYNSRIDEGRKKAFDLAQELKKENYTDNEIQNMFNRAWSGKDLDEGPFSAFRRAATDRANAKGLTQFRATDGALDTIDSFRSLFYKDKNHLSGKGIAAIATGAVGATYGIVKD